MHELWDFLCWLSRGIGVSVEWLFIHLVANEDGTALGDQIVQMLGDLSPRRRRVVIEYY
jgi:hypothetical protein